MLDGCSTHTIIHEKAIPWLKTKFVSSSVLEVENLHGEESYPVSLMEVELPRVGGNNVKIKAYAVNQNFPLWYQIEMKYRNYGSTSTLK